VCPVLTSIGTGVAVGLIVQGAVPQITKHYDAYIKPTIDSALENAKGHIEQISKNTLPPSTKKPAAGRSGKSTKKQHADKDCSVM
jgi:2-polyprenyl-3-methyl-5-hydroxy-6-metoxy-1,4-benzoquinol methylase